MKINLQSKFFLSCLFFLFFDNYYSLAQILAIQSKDTIQGMPKNEIFIGAYIKLVAAYDYLGLPNGSSFNMIEIPTVGDDKKQSLDFNAWQSRIMLKNNFITNEGEAILAFIEGDFHGGSGGGFRLRHAYVSFKHWTFGHTNSVFVNNDVWVNISDFDGPPVGSWVRQPQVRYTYDIDKINQLNFSIENPVVNVRQSENTNSSIVPLKPRFPDLLFNYRHIFKKASFQFSAVGRAISFKEREDRKYTIGYGANISGTFGLLKKDLLIYQLTAGKGIERYLVGLDGYGLDAIEYNSELVALPLYGGYVGYQHFWNSNLNSSFMYGYQEVKNNLYPDYANVFVGNYYSANLFFSPIQHVNLGFEFIYGDKTDYLNQKGRNHRMYFTMEYSF